MRFLITILALVLSLSAFASVPAGTAVQLLYNPNTVSSTTWVPLVNTTARYTQGVLVGNSNSLPVAIGMAAAGSVSGSEVIQVIIPGSGTVYVPLQIPAASRVSAISLGKNLNAGELDLTLVYY